MSWPSIRLAHLSFAYLDAVPLVADATLHLAPGWTGLVGPNGAGKSTLLRLLAEELSPSAGELHVDPPTARRILCRQSVEELDAEVETFAWDWEGPAHRLRGLLRLDPDQLERWPTLSPGERKRWQIGAALLAEPELLLLDEPTNHLDDAGRELLLEALSSFRGVGVVVSHDRELLDRLTAATLRLDRGEAHLWTGGYSAASAAWRLEARQRQAAREKLRRSEKKLRRRLHQAHQHQAAASRNRSPRGGRRDSDATSIQAGNQKRQAQARAGRQAAVVSRQLAATAERLSELAVRKRKGGSLRVAAGSAPRERLLQLDAERLTVGGGGTDDPEVVVLRDVHLWLDRGDRIWLRGANGSGKTTLLAALLATAGASVEHLLHLPQELDAATAERLLDDVRALEPELRGRVLQRLATLGADPEHLLASASPSPGEARKLLLAWGLGQEVAGLVLDEPTNHLDLPSIERLEEALADYPGALLLVTHDAALAHRVTRTEWRVRDGRVAISTLDEPAEIGGRRGSSLATPRAAP